MPPLRDPDRPEEWLRRAYSNLARARAGKLHPDVVFEDSCFDAQQAAEKALKAVLIHRRVRPPGTHSIADLLILISDSGVSVPPAVREASPLTRYAMQTRYPGSGEDVTEDEYRQAMELAEQVVKWGEGVVGSAAP